MISRVSLILLTISVIALLVMPVAFSGCDVMSQKGNIMFLEEKVPPIDLTAPEHTELATFALG